MSDDRIDPYSQQQQQSQRYKRQRTASATETSSSSSNSNQELRAGSAAVLTTPSASTSSGSRTTRTTMATNNHHHHHSTTSTSSSSTNDNAATASNKQNGDSTKDGNSNKTKPLTKALSTSAKRFDILFLLFRLDSLIALYCRIQKELAEITLDPPPNCRHVSDDYLFIILSFRCFSFS